MTPPEGEQPIYYVVSYRRQEKKSSDDSLSLALVNLTDWLLLGQLQILAKYGDTLA